MQNPFNHENYASQELKRNTFPCSFQTNLTMKYGYIYPAGIWRTIPGATYKIKPTLGLNFMPTVFPVQTRQKVYVHYFYGRDRNFWSDYKDFVNGQRPDLVKPYIDESITQARTGKLLDYLGVPTTLVGAYGRTSNDSFTLSSSAYDYLSDVSLDWGDNSSTPKVTTVESINDSISAIVGQEFSISRANGSNVTRMFVRKLNFEDIKDLQNVEISIKSKLPSSEYYVSYGSPYQESYTYNGVNLPYYSPTPRESNLKGIFSRIVVVSNNIVQSLISPSFDVENRLMKFELIYDSNVEYYFISPVQQTAKYRATEATSSSYSDQFINMSHEVSYTYFDSGVNDIDSTNSPYWRANDSRGKATIKLNAYLPRMYETIYNLYYRNPQNNPYILDGRPEYNKFIPSKDGGVDSTLYELRRRNWEDDFLTTAVQSPQQGIAPLVGLTDRGATLTLTNDDGSVTRYNVTTTDDGSISGIEATDTNAEPVLTKALIDAVSFGISIEDIRNVNAMQKWLELNLRKGYQYKDIIQARWGISISYNELDLPEFIGGFSRDVQLQAVTQTANVSDDVTGQLGWQAGRLFASGDGREITHYCDEEGFIMCLVCTVPVPNYSQLLPKHWFERDLLDSYQPEFNHIGFQPITYKEVCPIQAFQDSTENVNVLEQTFGYQRPWYQYFNYTDEVHGQFRTSFKDYLINRVFDVKPELSESFLLVDPEQINDVFNIPDVDDDKILGAIYHDCTAKLPISLYAQARLE